MKLSVAEREGKGDKEISGEQEARGSRPSCPFSLARGLAPNFLGPFFPFERLARRLHQNRVLSRLLLPNDRYDVCRRIQSYLVRTMQLHSGGGTWVFFGWVCAVRDSKEGLNGVVAFTVNG